MKYRTSTGSCWLVRQMFGDAGTSGCPTGKTFPFGLYRSQKRRKFGAIRLGKRLPILSSTAGGGGRAAPYGNGCSLRASTAAKWSGGWRNPSCPQCIGNSPIAPSPSEIEQLHVPAVSLRARRCHGMRACSGLNTDRDYRKRRSGAAGPAAVEPVAWDHRHRARNHLAAGWPGNHAGWSVGWHPERSSRRCTSAIPISG